MNDELFAISNEIKDALLIEIGEYKTQQRTRGTLYIKERYLYLPKLDNREDRNMVRKIKSRIRFMRNIESRIAFWMEYKLWQIL